MIGIPTRECRHNTNVPLDVRELFWQIDAFDKDAMTWRAGEPYTFCVMPRQLFEKAAAAHPGVHREIASNKLRATARYLIKKYEWSLVCDDRPDAVLVLSPAY